MEANFFCDSFASFLVGFTVCRPITIPSRRADAPSPTLPDEQISSHRTSTVPCPRPCLMHFRFEDGVARPKALKPCGLCRPCSPSETIEPKRPTATDDDSDSDSPSSVISSIYDIPMATIRPLRRTHGKVAPQVFEKEVVVMLEGEEEADSSYVTEIVPPQKAAETEESALDEAIAWAKEKSRASSLEGMGVREEQKHESRTEMLELVKRREGLFGRRGEGLQDLVYHLEGLRNGI